MEQNEGGETSAGSNESEPVRPCVNWARGPGLPFKEVVLPPMQWRNGGWEGEESEEENTPGEEDIDGVIETPATSEKLMWEW